MTSEIVDTTIDWIGENASDTVIVTFLGGEPTLNLSLISRAVLRSRIWTELSGVKFRFGMTTNGSLLNESMMRQLDWLGVSFVISIDSTGQFNDELRFRLDGKGGFDELARKVKWLKANGHAPTARMTVIPENIPHLAEDIESLQKIGFSRFTVIPVVPFGDVARFSWSEKDLVSFSDQIVSFINRRRSSSYPPILPYESPLPNSRAPYCVAARTMLAVDPKGDIYPCALFCGSEHSLLRIGNVQSGFNTDDASRVFEEVGRIAECKMCECQNDCSGPCAAMNMFENGDPKKISRSTCAGMKMRIKTTKHLINMKM